MIVPLRQFPFVKTSGNILRSLGEGGGFGGHPSLWTGVAIQHIVAEKSGLPPEALERFQSEGWWSRGESNPRPLECDSSALPTELRPHGLLTAGHGSQVLFDLLPKFGSLERVGDGCLDETELIADVVPLSHKFIAIDFPLPHEF